MGTVASFFTGVPIAAFGSTTARLREYTDGDQAIRRPVSTSRRIGFVQLRGGTGATIAAAQVANTLAQRRAGLILGASASGGLDDLGLRAGVDPHTWNTHTEAPRTVRTAKDATENLAHTPTGLNLVRIQGASPQGSVQEWADRVSPIARFFDVVVTDWGVRTVRGDLADAAGTSHVLCLLARADRFAGEEAAAVIPALQQLENAPQVVLALVDVSGTVGREALLVQRHVGVPTVRIPYDAALAKGRPVRTGTRLAYRRLTAELMGAAHTSTVVGRTPVRTGNGVAR